MGIKTIFNSGVTSSTKLLKIVKKVEMCERNIIASEKRREGKGKKKVRRGLIYVAAA